MAKPRRTILGAANRLRRAALAMTIVTLGGSTAPAADLGEVAGVWTCTAICKCVAAVSRDATITQDQDFVLLRNQCGDVSVGLVRQSTIQTQNWRVTGELSADGRTIRWSNGMVWARR